MLSFNLGPAIGSGPAEIHPFVVVQSDFFNRSRISTTVVCLITSSMDRALAPGNVPLRNGAAKLSRPSVVNVSQIMIVNKTGL